jgi:hypothetical protein
MALDAIVRDGSSGVGLAVLANGSVRVAPPTDNSRFYVHYPHDDGSLDAFERLRVSEQRNVFEYNFGALVPSSATTIWEATAVSSGTLALTTQLYGSDMSSLTTNGSGYWIQSYNHVRYRPGIGVLMRFTFNFNELTTNVRMRLGMFTDQGTFPSTAGDGFYIEADGAAIALVRRYSTTQSIGQEERVLQANWNLDKLDGTGSSGVNLDWTKAQHFVCEYQWLGVGFIRFGFDCGGVDGIVWCHEFNAANNITGPWGRTGSLPVRAEVFNTGVTATAGRLTLINVVVQHEGAIEDRQFRYFGATTGGTLRTVGTGNNLYPLMSLRAASTNDLTKRARIIPQNISVSVITAGTGTTSIQVALLMIPTPNTGATFSLNPTGSVTTVDTAATATTTVTGITIASYIIPNVVGTYTFDFEHFSTNMNLIGYNAAGSVGINNTSVLTLAAGPLTGTTTAAPAFAATINWKEIV